MNISRSHTTGRTPRTSAEAYWPGVTIHTAPDRRVPKAIVLVIALVVIGALLNFAGIIG